MGRYCVALHDESSERQKKKVKHTLIANYHHRLVNLWYVQRLPFASVPPNVSASNINRVPNTVALAFNRLQYFFMKGCAPRMINTYGLPISGKNYSTLPSEMFHFLNYRILNN